MYEKWGFQYKISFEIMVKRVPTTWTNVFRFMNNDANYELTGRGLNI